MVKRTHNPLTLVGYTGPISIWFTLEEKLPALTYVDDEPIPGSITIDDGLTEILNVSDSDIEVGSNIVAVQLERDVYVATGSGGSSTKIFLINDGDIAIGPTLVTGRMMTINVSPTVTLTEAEDAEDTELVNFRNNYILSGKYYVCYKIDGYWVIDNQASFLENI